MPSGADHAPGEVRGHPAPPDARAARVLKCHRVPRRRPRGALPATPFLALASDGNPRAGQHALDRWATRVGLSRPRTAAGAQAQAPCPAAGFRARGEGSFFCQLRQSYQPAACACRCSSSKCECQRLSEQGPASLSTERSILHRAIAQRKAKFSRNGSDKTSGQIQRITYSLRPFSASITFHPGAWDPGVARRRCGGGVTGRAK